MIPKKNGSRFDRDVPESGIGEDSVESCQAASYIGTQGNDKDEIVTRNTQKSNFRAPLQSSSVRDNNKHNPVNPYTQNDEVDETAKDGAMNII